MVDFNTSFGRRVERRLKSEKVIWFVTVGPDRTPQPRPVWFYWDGETFLLYSQPGGRKIRHLDKNPRVALHLNSDPEGDDVVVFTGEAAVDRTAPRADELPAYVRKYRKAIGDLEMTAEEFGLEYSVAIRVRPSNLRGA